MSRWYSGDCYNRREHEREAERDVRWGLGPSHEHRREWEGGGACDRAYFDAYERAQRDARDERERDQAEEERAARHARHAREEAAAYEEEQAQEQEAYEQALREAEAEAQAEFHPDNIPF